MERTETVSRIGDLSVEHEFKNNKLHPQFFLGRKYHIIGKELKKIRITLRTFREIERKWINAGQSHKN